jgi:hypothetical protein
MSGFESIKGVLNYRRSTVPAYRDIRDRPTWELLDTLYWDNRTDPLLTDSPDANRPLELINPQISTTGISGFYVRRMLRIDSEGERFYDGVRDVSAFNILFETNTNGRFQVYQDMRLVGPGNTQHLHANVLASFADLVPILSLFPILPPEQQDVVDQIVADLPPLSAQDLPVYNLSVTSASGSWTGATNVVVSGPESDVAARTVPVRIYRALN